MDDAVMGASSIGTRRRPALQSWVGRARACLLGALLGAVGCEAQSPEATAERTVAPVVSCPGGAYQPVDRAEHWAAVSGPALSVTGDLIFAPQLLQFEEFSPAGLRPLGVRSLTSSSAYALDGECGSAFQLLADPAPKPHADGSGLRLCGDERAGYVVVRVSERATRLRVAIFRAEPEPAFDDPEGAPPCAVFEYYR